MIIVLDEWGIDAPSTKAAVKLLDAIGVTGRALLVLGDEDENVFKSFRNLGLSAHCLVSRELNAYDVLVSDWVVFTKATLPTSAADEKDEADGSTPVAIAKGASDS
jgi:large subunit ribosomal protein L4